MSNSASDATNSDTFRTIEKRLGDFNPPVVLKEHIGSDLQVGESTLGGVTFVVKNRTNLLKALRAAKDITSASKMITY